MFTENDAHLLADARALQEANMPLGCIVVRTVQSEDDTGYTSGTSTLTGVYPCRRSYMGNPGGSEMETAVGERTLTMYRISLPFTADVTSDDVLEVAGTRYEIKSVYRADYGSVTICQCLEINGG